MKYYRIAGRLRGAPTWRWRTTKLTSLPAGWAHLQRYRWPGHTEVRVFFASSVEGLDEMLARANEGKPSASVPAEQIVYGQPLPRGELAGEATAGETPGSADQHPTPVAARPAFVRSEASLNQLELRRLELELGAGGDHDTPYTFAWPSFLPHTLAWIRVRSRVQEGEVAP